MDFWWFLYAVKWSLGAASSMNATVPGQNWIMGFFRNGPYLLGKSRVVRWSCSGTLGAPSPAQLSTLVEIRHGAGKSSDFGCFFNSIQFWWKIYPLLLTLGVWGPCSFERGSTSRWPQKRLQKWSPWEVWNVARCGGTVWHRNMFQKHVKVVTGVTGAILTGILPGFQKRHFSWQA